ncbi:MAG TPA: hypothetical protein VJB69_03085 [Candidatus Paceibacterota bacterium]
MFITNGTEDKHGHSRIKLCVSGAAETDHCGDGVLEIAATLGREVVTQGAVLVTGATTGFPLWAAKGAKEAGGISLGLSPASTEREHLEFYKLPLDYLDLVIYTGFGYSGRNLLLTRASDAVLIGCGRVGTINEFTVAFEDHKPIGVLDGCGPTAQVIRDIMDKGHRHNDNVIFDSDPKKLVARVIEMVKKEKTH